MIYSKNIPKTLNQGDILENIPKITPNQINFDQINDYWRRSSNSNELPRAGTFQVKPILSNGVILSQTCDLRPGFSILFGEIVEIPNNVLSSNVKKRIKTIRKIIRDDTRYHYFPSDSEITFFKKPKMLSFKSLFFIPFDFFQGNIQDYFVARLKDHALKVLKEKISRFFTRLAYEDVMFLSGDEISTYLSGLSEDDRTVVENTINEYKKN
ncbi:MAG: hypothetical protein ACTSVI_00205 [Promethearchaeota archaeon]